MNWLIRLIRGWLGIRVFNFDAAVMHAEGRKTRTEQLLKDIEALGGNPGPAKLSPEMIKMIMNCSAQDTLAALRLAGIEITVAQDIKAKNATIDSEVADTDVANTEIVQSEEEAIKILEETIKRLQAERAAEKEENEKQTAENNNRIKELEQEKTYVNSFSEYAA